MKTIKDISLLDILPPSIKDDEKIIALAKSLDLELQKLSLQTQKVLHLPNLDTLPHEVLDKLAWGFSIPFYQPEKMDIAKKRLLVSNAILQWRKIGTRYAMEKMLENFSQSAEVSEWFQPDYKNPRPYHFKLKLKRLEDLDGDNGELLMQLIDTVKNLRSWLDDFDFILTREGVDEVLHVGFADVTQGNNFFDLNSNFTDKQNIFIRQTEIESGKISFDDDLNFKPVQILRAGFINFQHGKITFKTEIEETDNLWYELWLNWIKSRWKDWKAAKIIWYEPEEPIDDDDEPEEFSMSGNFLKLYINFHNSDLSRLFVLPFPRDDFTAAEINAVPVDGIFIKRGCLSNKIYRAVLAHKEITQMQF